MSSNSVVAQMPPEGYFVPYAKRYAKNRFFLRRNPHHPFWWDVADSAFLQQVETALVDSEIREDSKPKCSLPSCRNGHGLDVCHHHGAAQNQQDRDLAVQRSLSGDAGVKRFPDQSTLRRFLKRLPVKSIRQLARLHDSLRAHLFTFPHTRSTLIFDLDSVVIVIYGRAEGARIGYNPKKRGRRSYHPLLCFEAHFQEFWHGSLRPGNTVTSTGAVAFLKICLAKVPQEIARSRIRFRMDSGFYRSRVVRFLDASGCGYVMRTPLRLSLGQNPYRYVDGQRCFLSNPALCCRYRSLVQKTLSAAPVPHDHSGQCPHRLPSFACQAGTRAQEECCQTSSRLPLPEGVLGCAEENRKVAPTQKFSFLQMSFLFHHRRSESKSTAFMHY